MNDQRHNQGDAVKKWIATFFGTGLMPAMPGTFGSLAAALVFYAVWVTVPGAARYVIIGLTLLAVIATLALAGWAQQYFRRPDPRPFVLDEVVGQWITLLFLPLADDRGAYVVVGFFLFRAFDVAKPFPVNRVESLSGAWGILLDDVAAALYSGIAFWVLLYLVRAVTGTA